MAGMSEKAPPRPRQITMAVAMSVVGSLLLVVSLFDTLGRLRTPDTRESIDQFLAELPGGRGDVETAQVVDALRALTFVSGALAAMLLVFAVFVLQRHRGARIGFTVVAVLLLVTIPVAGLMPVLLAVAAVLIWSQPGRDWYAGRTPAPALSPPPRPVEPRAKSEVPPEIRPEVQPPAGPPAGPPAVAEQGPPPAPYPFGSSPGADPVPQPDAHAQPHAQPYAQPDAQPSGPAGRDPDKRPFSVTLAAILTWLGAGLVAGGMVMFAVVLASGGQVFLDEFDKAAAGSDFQLSRAEVLAIGWGVTLFFLVWSLVSIVLAGLAFRRNNAARIALSVSATVAALLSLLMILSIVSVVTLLMAGAAAVLLFTGGANEWYSRRSEHPGGPPGPGYPGGLYGPSPYHQPSPPPEGRPKPW